MRFSRLLIALLLLLLGFVPLAAQSQQPSQASSAVASAAPFDSSPLLRGQVPPLNLKRLDLLSGTASQLSQAERSLAAKALMAQNHERCYTIRDYQFRQETPGSDATKLSGSSTCEGAGQFHARTIR
jgi:hypothetical protein